MSTTQTITGTDGAGNPARVTVTIDAPNQPSMLVGVNCDPGDYSATFARLPGAQVTRVFCKPGEGLRPWTDHRLADPPRSVLRHVSWKDWPDDAAAMLTSWLDAMPQWMIDQPVVPDLGISLVLTYLHEPEDNDVPAEEYKRRWATLQDVARSHRLGHLIALVPVQSSYWTVHHQAGDPMPWWAGVGDFAGVDLYMDLPTGKYPDPATFVAPWLAMAQWTGKRLWVAELGATLVASDTDGSHRAAWAREVVRLLRAGNCAAVSWWDALGTTKQRHRRDYRLDGRTAAAWADATKGSPAVSAFDSTI